MKYYKISLIVLLFNFYCTYTKAQLKKIEFHQLDSITTFQSRPTIIFIHTDWCKYCAAMKQSTFKNKEVIEIINNNYYFIEMNAESKVDIIFNKKKYSFQSNGNNSGVHELANFLGKSDGEISYPTLLIIDSSKKILFKNSGFISSKQMSFILQQFFQK